MQPNCTYSINETLKFSMVQRPFMCPNQFQVFFFKDPPLYSYRRCATHALVFEQDQCHSGPQFLQVMRVGDCPRCYQQLRLKTRSKFQEKIQKLEQQFSQNAKEAQEELKKYAEENQELQKALYKVYSDYENQLKEGLQKQQKRDKEYRQSLRRKK